MNLATLAPWNMRIFSRKPAECHIVMTSINVKVLNIIINIKFTLTSNNVFEFFFKYSYIERDFPLLTYEIIIRTERNYRHNAHFTKHSHIHEIFRFQVSNGLRTFRKHYSRTSITTNIYSWFNAPMSPIIVIF